MSSDKKRRAKFRADTLANQASLELHETKMQLKLYETASLVLLHEVVAWRKAHPDQTFEVKVEEVQEIPKDPHSELFQANQLVMRDSFFYDKPSVPALHLSRSELQMLIDAHHQEAFKSPVDSRDYLFHNTRAEFFRDILE